MPLHYVIDAYNIINHITFAPIRKKIKDPQRALLNFIKEQRLAKKSKNKITVVFDGYPKVSEHNSSEPDVDIVFSRDETADAKIKRMAEASKNPKNIVVISDDREIIFFIKSVGARHMGVEDFISPKKKAQGGKDDLIKAQLNYSQINKINQELKELWLK